jgi:hypothetical protein
MGKQGTKRLEVDEDMGFQQRSWRWQRIGWALIALIIVAALLGCFGSGLFDKARVGGQSEALALEYNRFGRAKAETSTLQVKIKAGTGTDGRVRLWLSREYLESVQIMSLIPQPVGVEAGIDRYTFVFSVSDASQPSSVTFRLEPERPGMLRGQIGIEGGQSLSFSQFVYP